MALTVDCTETVIGIPMTATYARITHYQGDKNYVMFFVEHHANESARQGNRDPVATLSFTVSTSDCDASLTSLYAWLKQQPAYITAEDC